MFPRYSLIFLCFVTFILVFVTCSQNSKKTDITLINEDTKFKNLLLALETLSNTKDLQKGTLAFALQSTVSNKTLVQFNAQKSLNVASCLKVITTATALSVLGEDYTFKTSLEYDGSLKNGILEGNLYIKGGGDPVLGSPLVQGQNLNVILNTWISKIKTAGISQIKGKIIADESLFFSDITPPDWNWSDTGNYFGAPAGAINVMDNSYRLFFKPTKLNEIAPILRTEPILPNVQFINEVRTAEANSGDQTSISGGQYENIRYASGTIPLGNTFSIRGSMPDPAFFLANTLYEKLKIANVAITEKPTTSRLLQLKKATLPTQRKLIYTHQSPKLKIIADYTNLYSVNLYAEAMLKMIGLQKLKKASTRTGAKAIQDFWLAQGIDLNGWFLTDGSGLSRSNAMTALQMTQILCKIQKLAIFKSLYASLPVSGVSGTMVNVLPKAKYKLHAKTGGMTRVIAYCGYFKNSKNELLAFSLVANQYNNKYKEIKAQLEKILEEMIR